MQKNKAKPRLILSFILLCVVLPAVVLLISLKLEINAYLSGSLICLCALGAVLFLYERSGPVTRELTCIASVAVIAAVSRAVFFALPQIKPIGAVIIITSVCMSPAAGFMTGALSMLLSNIIFGQGPWTPFQMLGMGTTAFLCSLLTKPEFFKKRRFVSSVICSLILFVFYGIFADTSTVLMAVTEPSPKSIAAVYIAGMPFNAVFAGTTFLILVIAAVPLIERIDRVFIKYDIFGRTV